MISKLTFYATNNTLPYLNLAVEEYLTLQVEEHECILFLWQNKRTVVIGRNQNGWKECKVDQLEEDGGYLVRRLSGGGAVYHDLGNLNFTFITCKPNYNVDKQLEVIFRAVQKLGIQAEKTGRNDITVEGRKFSGNAFYEANGHCYHHGTLLLSVDKTDMTKYLNVSKEKLQSKSVDSVKSRVANLSEYCPEVTVPLMKRNLIEAFEEVYGVKVGRLDMHRLEEGKLQRLEEKFASWEWKYGRKIPFQHQFSKRFSWGDIEFQLFVNEGVVNEINVFSDAMEQEFISGIAALIRGRKYQKKDMVGAVEELSLSDISEKQMRSDICSLLAENL